MNMPAHRTPDIFTAEHHAMLFAWIAEAVVEIAGSEKGEEVMRLAVRRYGMERGRRMALRAEADARPLNMLNYIAYAEWKAQPGEMKQKVAGRNPHAEVKVSVCPWHSAWEKSGMIPMGRFFCLEIDKALVSGFNPELNIDINSIHTDGSDYCDFVFREAKLNIPNLFLLVLRKLFRPGKKAVRSWDYHLGHLYKTLKTVITEELGVQGAEAAGQALKVFQEHFGSSAARKVLSFSDNDFNSLD
jgi:hypothetical protein